jgi:ABC-type transporter Mla maintaining outer membrane lipid asymmetry permease subunit MlaE
MLPERLFMMLTALLKALASSPTPPDQTHLSSSVMISVMRSLWSWLKRVWAAILLSGQAVYQIARGRIDRQMTLAQMMAVGPAAIVIAMITAAVIGMIFTIQVAREFLEIGSGDVVGGILVIARLRQPDER